MAKQETKPFTAPLSPEELDKRLVVVDPRGWIALVLTFLLILGALGWAIFGQIPNTLETQVILLNESGFEIIKAHDAGILKNLNVKRGDAVKKGALIAQVESEGKESPIYAVESGVVVEVFGIEGQRINKGDFLAIIQREKGEFYFFGFLPFERGQQIQKGMEAYIQPTGVDVKEHGSIIAKVSYISPYVVSQGQLLELLGDETLIPYFTQNKPVVEIILEPQKNPQSVTGYQWTSGVGPDTKILPLTIAKGLIVLQSRRPISYVVPVWRFRKALRL